MNNVKSLKSTLIEVKLIKSPIGTLPMHKNNLHGLGLKKIGQVVVRKNTPEIIGMISKVSHMVIVSEHKE